MGESLSITRRGLVKRAAGLATLGSIAAPPGFASAAPSKRRVAIIGAGAGGVAAAYFLADTHDVEVFEARSKIGGHCDSRTVEYRGHRIVVDIGAQFFHPDTHPIYVTLLRELGLYDPAHPAPTRRWMPPRVSASSRRPVARRSSPPRTPLATPQVAVEFASFTAPRPAGRPLRPSVGDHVEAWVADCR